MFHGKGDSLCFMVKETHCEHPKGNSLCVI